MMDYNDIDMLSTQQDNRRKIKLVKNGDPSQLTNCLIKEYINFEELAEIICDSIEISKREARNIRVFKTGGVEVFNEDVQYIKNNDILYVSFGEEFDESSNFAVFKLLRCLGEGGFGRVFEAKNRISKERVAIKMIDCSKISKIAFAISISEWIQSIRDMQREPIYFQSTRISHFQADSNKYFHFMVLRAPEINQEILSTPNSDKQAKAGVNQLNFFYLLLTKENAKDTDMVYKELIALKNLNHRNIVKVYNCYTLQKEQKAALILEYLDGGDLREYLNEKKVLPEKEAQKLFTQLYSAIQYCHRESIIHRDLKLENIMFEDKGKEKLKVVDFGISGRQSLVCVDHTEAGSVRYLSPEVITQHFPAHPCIDVWAMGCILYWMLTGNSPFPQNSREVVQDSIVKGKWSFSASDKKKLTKSVQELIQKMLTVNHLQRISMNEIGEHRWVQFFYDEVVQMELEEEEKKKKQQLEKQQSEDAKIESPQVLAPLKRKSGLGQFAQIQKSTNSNSQQSLVNGSHSQLSRNPYGIQAPNRKNSAFNSGSAYNSPQHHSNNSSRNLQQYSIFSPTTNNNNSSNSNYNPDSRTNINQDSNRLVLPKIDQKNGIRRFSYEPQSHFQQVNSFNSPRNNNNIASNNSNMAVPAHQKKESLFKSTATNLRQVSPAQNSVNSPIIKNHNHHESLGSYHMNTHQNGLQSMNDLGGGNPVFRDKNKGSSNASFVGRFQIKTKE